MLIDEVDDVIFKAGHGGAGKVSFVPSRTQKGGPDGGNGGRGGDVWIRVTSDTFALNQFSKSKLLEAENGEMGGKNKKSGSNGHDLEIALPLGTLVVDKDSGEEIDLNSLDQRILISKGGLGGRGNAELANSRNTTPKYAQHGLPGEERHLKLVLKLIADFGLIGLPNAGKSSLLNELTAANAKIANYPFTTLEPNLGVFKGRILADIPGLIEGAADGRGLGIQFLKHIEKVTLLLHCISSESEDVEGDYKTVINEMEKFNPELLQKEEVILLTKTDLVDQEEVKKKAAKLKRFKRKILPISIYDWDSLEKLRNLIDTKS
ncbi:MAG: GTPase ObgE [Patescibacteria group bacterium]|nr:GTPase ObgE [Patescibacteria group bacterium]